MEQIINRIIEIIEFVNKDVKINRQSDLDKQLTGYDIGLYGIDLVYIYLEICNEYGIVFESDEIEDYGFNTINGIAKNVQKKKV